MLYKQNHYKWVEIIVFEMISIEEEWTDASEERRRKMGSAERINNGIEDEIIL